MISFPAVFDRWSKIKRWFGTRMWPMSRRHPAEVSAPTVSPRCPDDLDPLPLENTRSGEGARQGEARGWTRRWKGGKREMGDIAWIVLSRSPTTCPEQPRWTEAMDEEEPYSDLWSRRTRTNPSCRRRCRRRGGGGARRRGRWGRGTPPWGGSPWCSTCGTRGTRSPPEGRSCPPGGRWSDTSGPATACWAAALRSWRTAARSCPSSSSRWRRSPAASSRDAAAPCPGAPPRQLDVGSDSGGGMHLAAATPAEWSIPRAPFQGFCSAGVYNHSQWP